MFLRLLLGIVLILLSGCMTTSEYIPNENVLMKGWYQPPEPSGRPKAYCYRTLGHNNCYNRPLPKSETRRVRSDESDELDRNFYKPTKLKDFTSPLDSAQMHGAMTPREGKTSSSGQSGDGEKNETAVPPKRLRYSSDTST